MFFFSGTLVLNVTVRGYKSKILNKFGIVSEFPEFTSEEDKGAEVQTIIASLSLFLVDEIVVSPNSLSIFNHPGNKEMVTVKQGSGYFDIALSATDIANIKYIESSKEIEVTPLKSGELTVQVMDLCLVTKPATLMVTVVSVGIIRVEMTDKVRIYFLSPFMLSIMAKYYAASFSEIVVYQNLLIISLTCLPNIKIPVLIIHSYFP